MSELLSAGESLGYRLTTEAVQRLPGAVQTTTSSLVNSCLEITPSLIDSFDRWLAEEQGTGEKTRRDYHRYLSRIVGLKLCGKSDIALVFERMGLTKTSYEAFSRLLTYLEKRTQHEALAVALRKALPRKPKAREDTYVPPDTKVSNALSCLDTCCGEPYTLFYLTLAYTGLRATEARKILEWAHRLKAIPLPYGAVRVHLPRELQRGSKRAYVAYMPAWLWEQIQAYTGRLPHQDTLEDKLRKCGLAAKYLRKWWRQKAKELGVDSETIEAFQGRPHTIGGRHYTDWLPILDREYQRIQQHIDNKLGTPTAAPTLRKL